MPETTDLAVQTIPTPAHILAGEREELLRQQIAGDNFTAAEVDVFIQVCNRTGLDPFMKQVYAIKRAGKMGIQVGIDGFRLIADRSGRYVGNDDPIYSGTPKTDGFVASVTVYKLVQGIRCPFAASARWSEYKPDAKQDHMWRKMPHVMLGKVAEALALRKAFPAELSGLYTDDEMAQADRSTTDANVDLPAAEVEADVDWVHRETIVAIREAIKALPAHVREASVRWPFVCGVDVLHEDKTAAIDEADGQKLLAQLLTMVDAAEPDPVEDAEVVLPCDADQAELPTATQIVDAIGDLSDYSDEIF